MPCVTYICTYLYELQYCRQFGTEIAEGTFSYYCLIHN